MSSRIQWAETTHLVGPAPEWKTKFADDYRDEMIPIVDKVINELEHENVQLRLLLAKHRIDIPEFRPRKPLPTVAPMGPPPIPSSIKDWLP